MSVGQASRRTFDIEPLTVGFVVTALINFAAGVALGVTMAVNPELWGELAAIHGELNPYGWLTMLIYGMTYAVLRLLAGVRLPRPSSGWLHLLVSEAGVVFALISAATGSDAAAKIGCALLAVSPLWFMANILSGVLSRRRLSEAQRPRHGTLRTVAGSPLFAELISRPVYAKASDDIAQRGTEMALISLIIAAIGRFTSALWQGSAVNAISATPTWTELSFYGWIAGSVLFVALHLHPRFCQRTTICPAVAQGGQILFAMALLFTLSSRILPTWAADAGGRLFGLSFCLFAFHYVKLPKTALLGRASAIAWQIGWAFALLLGAALVMGMSPLSIAAIHWLFLAWITTIVYAVAYALFPLVLGTNIGDRWWNVVQVVMAAVSAAAMTLGMYGLESSNRDWPSVFLALGGSLSAAAFLLFAGGIAVLSLIEKAKTQIHQA